MREKAAYFPIFFDLTEKPVLVIGAGPVGLRRAGVLAEFGAKVRVIAPECTVPAGYGMQGMELQLQEKKMLWEKRVFEEDDINGSFLVIAATDDEALNDRIVKLCRDRGILVNHAGDQSRCDFFFPAIVREKNLVLGVTSSGTDHRLVSRAASKLREWLKENL